MCFCEQELLEQWHSLPVYEFSPNLIHRYLASAYSNETPQDHLQFSLQKKSLLPRILQLMVLGYDLGIAQEYNLRELDIEFAINPKFEGLRTHWTKDEIDFVHEFASRYFYHNICHPDGIERFYGGINSVIDIIVMFYIAGLHIEPLLKLWLDNLSNQLSLLYLIDIISIEIEDGKFANIMTEDYQ